MPLLWDTTFTVHKMLDISVFRHFHSPSVVGRTSLGSCHKISWRESGFIEVWKSSKQLPARTAEINPVKIQYTISRYQLWRHAPLTKMQSTGDKWEVWAVLVSLKELLLRIHTVLQVKVNCENRKFCIDSFCCIHVVQPEWPFLQQGSALMCQDLRRAQLPSTIN